MEHVYVVITADEDGFFRSFLYMPSQTPMGKQFYQQLKNRHREVFELGWAKTGTGDLDERMPLAQHLFEGRLQEEDVGTWTCMTRDEVMSTGPHHIIFARICE